LERCSHGSIFIEHVWAGGLEKGELGLEIDLGILREGRKLGPLQSRIGNEDGHEGGEKEAKGFHDPDSYLWVLGRSMTTFNARRYRQWHIRWEEGARKGEKKGLGRATAEGKESLTSATGRGIRAIACRMARNRSRTYSG